MFTSLQSGHGSNCSLGPQLRNLEQQDEEWGLESWEGSWLTCLVSGWGWLNYGLNWNCRSEHLYLGPPCVLGFWQNGGWVPRGKHPWSECYEGTEEQGLFSPRLRNRTASLPQGSMVISESQEIPDSREES